MTYLTRHTLPGQDLRAFQSQLNRLFEPFRGRFTDDEDLASNTWLPAVDIAEDADRIVVTAEVPGMKQEDIEINFDGGLLTIRGARKFEKEDNERTYHRLERAYGSFVRTFTLPRTVDADKITANYKDGVLDVVIPKKEEAKPKQIRIGINS
jgi:HSP20 family protein